MCIAAAPKASMLVLASGWQRHDMDRQGEFHGGSGLGQVVDPSGSDFCQDLTPSFTDHPDPFLPSVTSFYTVWAQNALGLRFLQLRLIDQSFALVGQLACFCLGGYCLGSLGVWTLPFWQVPRISTSQAWQRRKNKRESSFQSSFQEAISSSLKPTTFLFMQLRSLQRITPVSPIGQSPEPHT